ncbi:hypothetical protein [Streptomyces canus]|uniref:hypothetical protein n=1 Tax=Streptomyces canus TaxID=58343 RepID=UPI0030E2FC76
MTTLNLFDFAFQALFILYAPPNSGSAPASFLGAVLGSGAAASVLGSALTGMLTLTATSRPRRSSSARQTSPHAAGPESPP